MLRVTCCEGVVFGFSLYSQGQARKGKCEIGVRLNSWYFFLLLMLANDHSTMDSGNYGLDNVGREPRYGLLFIRDRMGKMHRMILSNQRSAVLCC